MAENTKIEWCDHTFNPWTGCTKVSPGCDHCYAESWAKRSGAVQWGADHLRRRTMPANWRKPMQWQASAAAFMAEHGRRQRVFCASLADVFDNAADDAWRLDLFWLIHKTPDLDWLLLTKRIGNVRSMLANAIVPLDPSGEWPVPLPNVWIGATVVNQEEADRDIGKLLDAPAAVRFLSIEPMLGPINLERWIEPMGLDTDRGLLNPGVDWVICGGESGPGARPMNPDWARSLRDQCAASDVPFLFKQWGEWGPMDDFELFPGRGQMESLRVFIETDRHGFQRHGASVIRRGKKANGRLLDGVAHDGYPTTASRQPTMPAR